MAYIRCRFRGFLPRWAGGWHPTDEAAAFHNIPALPNSSTHFAALPTDELTAEELERKVISDAERLRGRHCPEEDAGFFSRTFFVYVSGLLNLGYDKTLEQEDLWDVCKEDEAIRVSRIFENTLAKTRDDMDAPYGRVGLTMWRIHRKRFVLAGVGKLVR